MYDILSVFSVLYPHLSTTSVRQFSRVVLGLLAMTGRVTMLNMSRWTSEGGSYRTVQRFFNTLIPWGSVYWVFFTTYLLDRESAYILAGDKPSCQNRVNPLMVYRVSSRLRKVKRYRV